MEPTDPQVLERARRVRLMLFDVDGVLTDGRLWYGPTGESLKAFHSLDGHGIKMLAASGVPAGVITSRSSPAVAQRAAELGIAHVLQDVADKRAAFEALAARTGIAPQACGYMGDDVIDLPVLVRCGFACAPREAHEMVRQYAHYVCRAGAGAGAAREVCELVMRAQGTLETALSSYVA